MSEATVINGKQIAREMRAAVAAHIDVLVREHGLIPSLAVIMVGNDPASQIYVSNKKKRAEQAGISSQVHMLRENTTEETLLALIQRLNADKHTHGILVQMPLPAHINTSRILSAIDPLKDVDGLHPANIGKLVAGQLGMVPCTPLGCMTLIKSAVKDLKGLHAVVLGRSVLVGKPVAALLLAEDCTVTIAHSRSADLPSITRQADILVIAAGKPGLVTAEMVKPGAIVIDVGISRLSDKIVGDVDFHAVAKQASFITPVPGGVGPMTIACLLGNTVIAACLQQGIDIPKL